MRQSPRITAALTMTACLLSQAWEFRYGQQPDQKPEWTAMGRIPDWIISVSEDGREVSYTDQPDGRCRGFLFVGRSLTLPDPPPAVISVELDYKTYCEMAPHTPRSGTVDIFLMTRAGWDRLARTPQDARMMSLRRPPDGMIAVSVKGQGEDCVEWTPSGTVNIQRLPETMRNEDELIVGVAWGTYHFCTEWGAFRNLEVTMLTAEQAERQFWAVLDLDHPGLEQVRAALEMDDLDAATHALAGYYRQRREPLVANPVEPATPGVMRRADETMQRTYRLAGCPVYTFDGPIVWNLDPFDYNQWAIALNRHAEWRFLAAAYLHTGAEDYAREWAHQLNDWVACMPLVIGPNYIQGPFNVPGHAPLSLDAGIRLGFNWFPAFQVFRKSPAVDDDTIVAFLRSCLDHAAYLMKDVNFRSGSNWGAMESNGLFHIGVMLPEFREARIWRDTALRRTTAELQAQVYPDGAQHELTPGYHWVSLNNFLRVMELARANDIPLASHYVDRLERMFEYYLRIAMPDFRAPALNDSGRTHISGILAKGAELFPQRQDFLWAATARREGHPPEFLSNAMPYAGWITMRSGWGPNEHCLTFDAGPFGTGHQHEDKLGILLFAYGRMLLTEGGIYAYDTSEWRRYVLSTRAHNTIRVDGKDQNCRADRGEYIAAKPDTHGFFDTEAFCYARDTHSAGYGNPPDLSVVHRRRVLYVKPSFWIVVDDLGSNDDKPHSAESQFLLDADAAIVDPESLIATSVGDGGRVAIIPLTLQNLSARIAQGETEPEVRGFIPEGFNTLRPAPAVLYTLEFRERGRLAYAIVPFKGDTCPVSLQKIVNADGQTEAVLNGPDNRNWHLAISDTSLKSLTPEFPFIAEEHDDLIRRTRPAQ